MKDWFDLDRFKEKLGPLPVWAWGLILGVVAVAIYFLFLRGKTGLPDEDPTLAAAEDLLYDATDYGDSIDWGSILPDIPDIDLGDDDPADGGGSAVAAPVDYGGWGGDGGYDYPSYDLPATGLDGEQFNNPKVYDPTGKGPKPIGYNPSSIPDTPRVITWTDPEWWDPMRLFSAGGIFPIRDTSGILKGHDDLLMRATAGTKEYRDPIGRVPAPTAQRTTSAIQSSIGTITAPKQKATVSAPKAAPAPAPASVPQPVYNPPPVYVAPPPPRAVATVSEPKKAITVTKGKGGLSK